MKRILGVLMLALCAPAGARAMHPVRAIDVYAHRGGAGLAPENTLGAFRAAHEAWGARGVWLEMDTQLAADGELVVIHDATLDRTTDCSGNVLAKTSVELASCDATETWPAWPFEPVPTMRAVLAEGAEAGWRILVELKNIPYEPNFDATGRAAAAELVALLAETGFPAERIAVQSFFPTSLDQIELMRPDVATALLTTSEVGFLATENAAYATARGYEIVAPDDGAPDLSADTVAQARALGRRVVVWTVNEPDAIARAMGWGVDGIISDRPDRVFEALGPSHG